MYQSQYTQYISPLIATIDSKSVFLWESWDSKRKHVFFFFKILLYFNVSIKESLGSIQNSCNCHPLPVRLSLTVHSIYSNCPTKRTPNQRMQGLNCIPRYAKLQVLVFLNINQLILHKREIILLLHHDFCRLSHLNPQHSLSHSTPRNTFSLHQSQVVA